MCGIAGRVRLGVCWEFCSCSSADSATTVIFVGEAVGEAVGEGAGQDFSGDETSDFLIEACGKLMVSSWHDGQR